MGYTPPTLYVNKIAGGWTLTAPDNTATDDLTIFPNTVDTVCNIKLYGGAGCNIITASGAKVVIQDGGGEILAFYDDATDTFIENQIANRNIYLKTAGTGVVKFGTYTAGAATDSTGYITILDAAGNTRKLMVQA